MPKCLFHVINFVSFWKKKCMKKFHYCHDRSYPDCSMKADANKTVDPGLKKAGKSHHRH